MCIYMCTHTHSLWLAQDTAWCRIFPAELQSILTNTVYVPSCPQQRGSCSRLDAFLPLMKDPGCFQQRGELGSHPPWVPVVHGLAAAPSKSGGRDTLPGAFLAAGSPLHALPTRRAAQDRGSE